MLQVVFFNLSYHRKWLNKFSELNIDNGRNSHEISDEKIALLGAIQSLFEGSMYTFVFLWTPALSPNDEEIPHGFIFATFMLSSMLGSSIASRLLARKLKVEGYMQIVFSVSAFTLFLPVVTNVSLLITMFICSLLLSLKNQYVNIACLCSTVPSTSLLRERW